MATSHHGCAGDDQKALRKLFMDQVSGIARRAWPDGRASADDDGVLTFAMKVDLRHRVIRIVFPKPTMWLGLDRESAEILRDELTERILELQGVKDASVQQG